MVEEGSFKRELSASVVVGLKNGGYAEEVRKIAFFLEIVYY